MTQEQGKLAPPRCPHCLYDLIGLRVGQNCPECGEVIRTPRKSTISKILVRASLILTYIGLGFVFLTTICIASGFSPFLVPISVLMLGTGFVMAIFARSRLRREHCYDKRVRDQIGVCFISFFFVIGLLILFLGADWLIEFTNSLN